MLPVVRAAVIGTHWGLAHVSALRVAGATVVALCGRDAERTEFAATDAQIEHAVVDVEDLQNLDLDVVAVATPASTHAGLLAKLGSATVLCEPPLLGLHGSLDELRRRGQNLWVNSTFAFTDSARAAQKLVAASGLVRKVEIETRHDLARNLSPREWFVEAVAAPWGWVTHLLGAPEPLGPQAVPGLAVETDERSTTVLSTSSGGIPVDLTVGREPGMAGISHEIQFDTQAGRVRVPGFWRDGAMWRFGPISLAGRPLSEVESGPTDPWQRANHRSVAAFVEMAKGAASPEETRTAGLLDAETAAELDRCVRQAWDLPDLDRVA